MTRCLVLGDLHLDARLHGRDYHDDVSRILFEEVLPRVSSNDVVIQLGDVTDPDRGARTFRALCTLREFLGDVKHRGARAIVLAGNHDVIDDFRCSECQSTLHGLDDVADVVEVPRVFEVGGAVLLALPWMSQAHVKDRSQLMLDTFESTDASTIVALTHLDIPGLVPGGEADMPRMGKLEIPSQILESDRVKLVLAGHIHKPQIVGKVQVVGSLARLGFGEAKDQKGFVEVEL